MVGAVFEATSGAIQAVMINHFDKKQEILTEIENNQQRTVAMEKLDVRLVIVEEKMRVTRQQLAAEKYEKNT